MGRAHFLLLLLAATSRASPPPGPHIIIHVDALVTAKASPDASWANAAARKLIEIKEALEEARELMNSLVPDSGPTWRITLMIGARDDDHARKFVNHPEHEEHWHQLEDLELALRTTKEKEVSLDLQRGNDSLRKLVVEQSRAPAVVVRLVKDSQHEDKTSAALIRKKFPRLQLFSASLNGMPTSMRGYEAVRWGDLANRLAQYQVQSLLPRLEKLSEPWQACDRPANGTGVKVLTVGGPTPAEALTWEGQGALPEQWTESAGTLRLLDIKNIRGLKALTSPAEAFLRCHWRHLTCKNCRFEVRVGDVVPTLGPYQGQSATLSLLGPEDNAGTGLIIEATPPGGVPAFLCFFKAEPCSLDFNRAGTWIFDAITPAPGGPRKVEYTQEVLVLPPIPIQVTAEVHSLGCGAEPPVPFQGGGFLFPPDRFCLGYELRVRFGGQSAPVEMLARVLRQLEVRLLDDKQGELDKFTPSNSKGVHSYHLATDRLGRDLTVILKSEELIGDDAQGRRYHLPGGQLRLETVHVQATFASRWTLFFIVLSVLGVLTLAGLIWWYRRNRSRRAPHNVSLSFAVPGWPNTTPLTVERNTHLEGSYQTEVPRLLGVRSIHVKRQDADQYEVTFETHEVSRRWGLRHTVRRGDSFDWGPFKVTVTGEES